MTENMLVVFAVIAIAIFIAGVIMMNSSLKTGRIFDCLEGSKTERTWVIRSKNAHKYWLIVIFYIVVFSVFVGYFSYVAFTGNLSF
jgi:nitrate/nitrite transporter NarK